MCLSSFVGWFTIITTVDPAVNHVYKAAYEKENADQFQSNLKKYRQKGKIMKDQVVYYILKTFQHFLQSSMTLEEFKDDTNWKRHYYPGKLKQRVNNTVEIILVW